MRANGELAGKALGEAGDQMANRYLLRHLAADRPDDGVLSEESADSSGRLAKSRVWIIDPLDGTREYGEARPDWAVHVGLAIDGVAAIGAVALPGLDGGVVLRSNRPTPPPAHDRSANLASTPVKVATGAPYRTQSCLLSRRASTPGG